MPSGAKKRKAAKKKKENQSSSHHENQPPHSPGDIDLKHHSQEDKDSDVSEVSSPASQDHHGHQSITFEGEVEEIEAKELQIDEGIQQQKPTEEEEGSAEIERGFKIEDKSDMKSRSPKNDELPPKSYDGDSSGSSSDDESKDDAKISQNIVDASNSLSEPKAIGESSDSILADSEKIPSLSEKAEEVIGSQAYTSVIGTAESVVVKENGQENQSYVEDKVDLPISSSGITRFVEKNDEVSDPIAQQSDKNLVASYNATEPTSDIGVVSEADSRFTQPFIAAPPRPVQATSWKGCCGLFELFTGSGRYLAQ